MGLASAHTRKVQRALELVGLEGAAHDVVTALGVRDMVIVDRRHLIDERWLVDRLRLLDEAKRIQPYRDR